MSLKFVELLTSKVLTNNNGLRAYFTNTFPEDIKNNNSYALLFFLVYINNAQFVFVFFSFIVRVTTNQSIKGIALNQWAPP